MGSRPQVPFPRAKRGEEDPELRNVSIIGWGFLSFFLFWPWGTWRKNTVKEYPELQVLGNTWKKGKAFLVNFSSACPRPSPHLHGAEHAWMGCGQRGRAHRHPNISPKTPPRRLGCWRHSHLRLLSSCAISGCVPLLPLTPGMFAFSLLLLFLFNQCCVSNCLVTSLCCSSEWKLILRSLQKETA